MRIVYSLSILTGLLCLVSACHGNVAPDAVSEPSAPPSATSASIDPASAADADSVPAPRATQNAARSDDPRPLLVCFGDSLTAGLGTDPGESYPDYLQADLDQMHYRYRVDNEGISGNTTKDGVERLPEILALHPAAVIVEFGGNDGLRGLPIAETRANLDQIVGTLQSAGIKVALAGITLPPDYGPDYIQRFNQTYVLLARKYRVPMLPFLLKNVYGVPGMMQADKTHATAKGNAVVARNVVPLVAPLLKK